MKQLSLTTTKPPAHRREQPGAVEFDAETTARVVELMARALIMLSSSGGRVHSAVERRTGETEPREPTIAVQLADRARAPLSDPAGVVDIPPVAG